MSYFALVQRDFAFRGWKLFLAQSVGNGYTVLHRHDGQNKQVEATVALDPEDYLCRIPDGDAARAILGELARQLGAVEHPEQLRADFDHMRKRHDILVDALIDGFRNAPFRHRAAEKP